MEYTEAGERLKDQTKCAHARAELKMCLLKTDCCKIVSYFTWIFNVSYDFKETKVYKQSLIQH